MQTGGVQRGLDKPPGVVSVWIVQYLPCRPVLHDSPVLHDDHIVAEGLHDLEVVTGEQIAEVMLSAKIAQEIYNLGLN